MNLSFHEIARAVGALNDVTAYPDYPINQIEFDSRKIVAGDLFLPLKGTRDGHDFIDMALTKGAVATFSEKPVPIPHILVSDCLTAFQDLARYYLDKTEVDVIAVTGSNGKTTTKDMIHHVLATSFATYKTQGNYNNEIGLPYTVLHMPTGTEKLVLEMGQDHLGDIHLLSMIARPKMAVVTLIGEAHLEFFGSRNKIAEGKLQIADGMPEGSVLLVPQDPILTPYLPSKQRVVTFGEMAELSLTDLLEEKTSLTFRVNFLAQPLTLPITGKYNATNAMVAAYVAQLCGVGEERIQKAFSQLELTRNRTEWKIAANGAEILSDVYNANPTAMRLILETFVTIPANLGGRKLVVLADMKELGPDAPQLHAGIKASLTEAIDRIYLYGPEMQALADVMADDERVCYYGDINQFDQLKAAVKADLNAQDQILLKGSNSMALGDIVDFLQDENKSKR